MGRIVRIKGWGRVTWQEIARRDARDGVRAGGVWALTGIFLFLTVIVGRFASRGAYLDASALADTNAQTFIVVLAFLFVPILGLYVSVSSIVRARESDLVDLSTGEQRRDLLLGTFLGRGGVVTAAIAVGFLPAFVLLVLQSETTPLFAVFVFFVTAVLFGLLFVAFGLGISALARTKRQAAAGGVVAFLALYAWPFVPLVPVPHSVLETFWVVFVFGDVTEALFAIRQGDPVTASLLGFLVIAVLIALPLAVGYRRLDRPLGGTS